MGNAGRQPAQGMQRENPNLRQTPMSPPATSRPAYPGTSYQGQVDTRSGSYPGYMRPGNAPPGHLGA
jgi:hypothetical protein